MKILLLFLSLTIVSCDQLYTLTFDGESNNLIETNCATLEVTGHRLTIHNNIYIDIWGAGKVSPNHLNYFVNDSLIHPNSIKVNNNLFQNNNSFIEVKDSLKLHYYYNYSLYEIGAEDENVTEIKMDSLIYCNGDVVRLSPLVIEER